MWADIVSQATQEEPALLRKNPDALLAQREEGPARAEEVAAAAQVRTVGGVQLHAGAGEVLRELVASAWSLLAELEAGRPVQLCASR